MTRIAFTVPRYTVAELDDFPDDGNRYELLDGVLMVTPSPGSPHQGIATRLAITLGIALQIPGHAHIYAPWLVDIRDRSVEVCKRRGTGDVVRDVIRWHVAEIDQTVDVDLHQLLPDSTNARSDIAHRSPLTAAL